MSAVRLTVADEPFIVPLDTFNRGVAEITAGTLSATR